MREDDTLVRSIYNEAMRPLMDAGYEFVTEVPTFDVVKAGFYRARKQLRWSVHDPQTVEELEIPADLVALRGDFIYCSGCNYRKEKQNYNFRFFIR